MAYGGFKYSTRRTPFDKTLHDKVFIINKRTPFDKTLHDKVFNIAKTPKYDRYQSRLTSMVYISLIKKLLVMVLKMRIFQPNN